MTTEFNFAFIGWNMEGTSDKIWGYFTVGSEEPNKASWRSDQVCYIFWGRRGKTPSFKKDRLSYGLLELRDHKLDKGYVQIDSKKLRAIWPDIGTVLEGRLAFQLLADKV